MVCRSIRRLKRSTPNNRGPQQLCTFTHYEYLWRERDLQHATYHMTKRNRSDETYKYSLSYEGLITIPTTFSSLPINDREDYLCDETRLHIINIRLVLRSCTNKRTYEEDLIPFIYAVSYQDRRRTLRREEPLSSSLHNIIKIYITIISIDLALISI